MWLYEVLNEGTDDLSKPVILVVEGIFFIRMNFFFHQFDVVRQNL